MIKVVILAGYKIKDSFINQIIYKKNKNKKYKLIMILLLNNFGLWCLNNISNYKNNFNLLMYGHKYTLL